MHDFATILKQIMANDNKNISKHYKTQEKRKKETQTPRTKNISFGCYILKRLISRPFRSHQNAKNAIKLHQTCMKQQSIQVSPNKTTQSIHKRTVS
jgi:hypothetical protein